MITKEKRKLIKFFKSFQLLDLLGFANILRVKEKDFKRCEDFIEAVIDRVLEQPKKERAALIKLAKDISLANKDSYCGGIDRDDCGGKDNDCGDTKDNNCGGKDNNCCTSCGDTKDNDCCTSCGRIDRDDE